MSTVPTTPPTPRAECPHSTAYPTYRPVHHGDVDSGWDAIAMDFDPAGRGEVEVCTLDLDEPNGPHGVDLYRPTDRTLTPTEARTWAAAVLAAADLAEQLDRARGTTSTD